MTDRHDENVVDCARTEAVLMATLSYGFADELRAYPGTVGVSMDTFGHVVADLCEHIGRHGFTKIVFLAGHDTNTRATELGFERLASLSGPEGGVPELVDLGRHRHPPRGRDVRETVAPGALTPGARAATGTH